MLDPAYGMFDHVVAMDSLIHYALPDMTDMLAKLAARSTGSVCFTYAPRTPVLAFMHTAGKLFPRGDRSPAIVPHRETDLRKAIAGDRRLAGWTLGAQRPHHQRVLYFAGEEMTLA